MNWALMILQRWPLSLSYHPSTYLRFLRPLLRLVCNGPAMGKRSYLRKTQSIFSSVKLLTTSIFTQLSVDPRPRHKRECIIRAQADTEQNSATRKEARRMVQDYN